MSISVLKTISIYKLIKYFKFNIIIIMLIAYKIIKYFIKITSKILNKIFYEKTIIGYVHNKILYLYDKFITKLPSALYYCLISNLGILSLYNVIMPKRLYRISKCTYCTGIKSLIVFILLIALKAFSDIYLK